MDRLTVSRSSSADTRRAPDSIYASRAIKEGRAALSDILGEASSQYFSKDQNVEFFLADLKRNSLSLDDREKVKDFFLMYHVKQDAKVRNLAGARTRHVFRTRKAQDGSTQAIGAEFPRNPPPSDGRNKLEKGKAWRKDSFVKLKQKIKISTDGTKRVEVGRSTRDVERRHPTKETTLEEASPFQLSLPPLFCAVHRNDSKEVQRLLAGKKDPANKVDPGELYLAFRKVTDFQCYNLQLEAEIFLGEAEEVLNTPDDLGEAKEVLRNPDHLGEAKEVLDNPDDAVRFVQEGLLAHFPLLYRSGDDGLHEAARFSGTNALTCAILSRASIEIIGLLWEAVPTLLDRCDGRNETPLTTAIALGDTECARYLLSLGANLRERNGRTQSPVVLAVRARQEENVKRLVRRGADIFANDFGDATAIATAYSQTVRGAPPDGILAFLFKNAPEQAKFYFLQVNKDRRSGTESKTYSKFLVSLETILDIRSENSKDTELFKHAENCLDGILVTAQKYLNAVDLFGLLRHIPERKKEIQYSILVSLGNALPRYWEEIFAIDELRYFNHFKVVTVDLYQLACEIKGEVESYKLAMDCFSACLLNVANACSFRHRDVLINFGVSFFSKNGNFGYKILENLLARTSLDFVAGRTKVELDIQSSWTQALERLDLSALSELVANVSVNSSTVRQLSASLFNRGFEEFLANRAHKLQVLRLAHAAPETIVDLFVQTIKTAFTVFGSGIEPILSSTGQDIPNVLIACMFKDLSIEDRRRSLENLPLADLKLLRRKTKEFGDVGFNSKRLKLLDEHIHMREKKS